MALEHLYSDKEVVEEVRIYFNVKEINQLIKSQAQPSLPRTNNSPQIIGTCFDIYFKFLLWDYLNKIGHHTFEVGDLDDWGISFELQYSLNDSTLPDRKQATACTTKTFKELDKVINSDKSSKYENLANLSQTMSYLKAWRHRRYVEMPEPSPEITSELIQLGILINFDELNISKLDKVYINPKSLIDYKAFIPDILIGSTLVDIKTKYEPKLNLNDVIQILCYFSLCQEPRSNFYLNFDATSIDSIGFYFSRHGFYWKPNLTDYINKNELKSLVELLNYNIKHYLY